MPALAGARLNVLLPALLVAAIVLLPTAVGVAIGLGQPLVVLAAALPMAAIALGTVALHARWVLVFVGIAVGYFGDPLNDRIDVGGAGIWASDIVIGLAAAGWLVEWLAAPGDRRPRIPRAVILGVPSFLFTVALLIGAWRGHERYGASLIGMPLRLAAYAVVAMAMTNLTPRRAVRGLTVVFYGGALYQAGTAIYHIATGTSATEHLKLSTGGIRYIGIAAATYAAASVLIALLNLASSRTHKSVHLTMLVISCFTVLVAYTRTVWLAIGIVLLLALIASHGIRRSAMSAIPVVAPFAVVAVLMVTAALPDLIGTFTERLSTPASQDSSVEWRTRAYEAVLAGVSDERALGVGFGRTTSFSINGQPNYVEGDPHNGFIYVYAGGGLLALGALILLLLAFLADSARRWRWADEEGRTLIAFCVGTWFVFVVHAAAEPIFTEPLMVLVIWILMLLPAVVVKPRELAGRTPQLATTPEPRRAGARAPARIAAPVA